MISKILDNLKTLLIALLIAIIIRYAKQRYPTNYSQ